MPWARVRATTRSSRARAIWGDNRLAAAAAAMSALKEASRRFAGLRLATNATRSSDERYGAAASPIGRSRRKSRVTCMNTMQRNATRQIVTGSRSDVVLRLTRQTASFDHDQPGDLARLPPAFIAC